ncbi:MAG: metallophosphoesterase [Caulobacter sp.]|nr:metallophosphoesterase [Caulobacter sp.]
MTRPFKIVQVSDIHFGGDENRDAVEAAVARIQAEQPDLVVAAGDLTKDGGRAEFVAARAWLERLPHPQLRTPGNHDTPYLDFGLVERFFAPWMRYEAALGPARRVSWVNPRAAVFAVNTARGVQLRLNWSKGAISPRQTRRIERSLTGADPGGLKVVVCHHPLMEVVGGPMTGRVHGGTAAAQAFALAGADLVLSGHIHVPFVTAYPFGDGRTQAVGSGTLSIRERGAPPSFNLIEADDHEIRVTALAFERGAFSVWRTWATERRRR